MNWDLVEGAIDYVRGRLNELRMPTERHIVMANYNLDPCVLRQNPADMTRHIWDNKLSGNRHVIIEEKAAYLEWD